MLATPKKLPIFVNGAIVTALAVALSLVACGGGGKSKSPAAASATEKRDGAVFEERAEEGGLPGWVNRGSGAVAKEDGRRVFYGVGAASGIKNPAMLRSTVDNRARNEIAKLVEVFSASLMKDYMNSSGEQNVEQAVKTAASSSLKGVEIVDRYVAGDGTTYSLAALDLKKAMELIAAAEASGAVKSHVQKVDVDDIFDERSKKAAPPPPPPRVEANEDTKSDGGTGAATAAAPKGDNAKTRKGEKPGWVDGQDPNFPWREYLCGVGFGGNRSIAESGAYASLARIFKSRVESVSQDFMGAYSKTGAKSLEMQSSEQLTRISTEKLFSGVYIAEVWEDGAKKTMYALACLERAKAGRTLREQIQTADERAEKSLGKAEGADKATQLRELSRALEAIVEREALNGELRIVDADGIGEEGRFSHADVASALEGAVEALRIAVVADGPYAEDFRSALMEGLTRRGYKVSDETDGEVDVLIQATIRIEDGGKGTGSASSTSFARGVIQLEVKNMAQNRVIAAMNESRKEGHRSKDEAERRVVRQLGKELVDKVGEKIDSSMKGR